jgi:hypothetical protein
MMFSHVVKAIALAAFWLLSLQFSFAQNLGIAVTNGALKVSWPQTNYYSLLQSKTNLAITNGWIDVGSASPATVIFSSAASRLTNFSGGNIIFTQQVTTTSQFFRLKSPALIPVFGFSIFYDGLLEFTGSATMQINGAVHANGPIYVGTVASASQIFNETVTSTNTISSPATDGYTPSSLIGTVAFNGSPPLVTNVPALVSMIGTNNRHGIIEIPPAGEQVESFLGRARLYNQAQMLLLVTNSPLGGGPKVTVIMQTGFNGLLPGADFAKAIRILTNTSTAYLSTNPIIPLPFLSLTNMFADLRQNQAAQFVTQVDVGQLNDWLRTNAFILGKFTGGNYPTILYVADQRNIGSTTQAVVRLTRAAKLPFNNGLGFTVATQNPLYLWGDYNTTINSNTYATTVGSTTNGAAVPAALIADAITILSPNWLDALSASAFSSRTASSMTVNAALLGGNVPSTGATSTTFSGGVHNLTRFLENWAGVALTYNTSLVCLFGSKMATNQWRTQHNTDPNGYYDPPTRLWAFDVNFLNPSKLPPGTPIYSLP